MREICTVQVGGCGNQVGDKFWETICYEHGIDVSDGRWKGESDLQLERLDVLFTEASSGRYCPRNIMADLSQGTIAQILSGPNGALYRPDSVLSANYSAANNYARGFYGAGADMAESIMDRLRQDVESADSLQGIVMTHSIGGGTGGGMGSLLMGRMREEYDDRVLLTYSVVPNSLVSETVVEPYNAVLSLHELSEFSDGSMMLENEVIGDICQRVLKIKAPSFADLNHLVAAALGEITSCLRFPGQLNCDIRKLVTNLVPFQRLHFFVTGFAPLASFAARSYQLNTATEICSQLFSPDNMLTRGVGQGKFLTAAAMFRGKFMSREIDTHIMGFLQRNRSAFVDFIPHNFKTSLCDVAAKGLKVSAGFMGNSTSTQFVMMRLKDDFEHMLNRRAYLHWYTEEGMDESEFREAEGSVMDMIHEYQQYYDAVVDEPMDEGEGGGAPKASKGSTGSKGSKTSPRE